MFADRDLVQVEFIGRPTEGGACVPRAAGEAWIARYGENGKWRLIDVPTCPCCGEPAWPNGRCTKHQDRNPCVVDGCGRTTAAKGQHRSYQWICGEHWRRYVPARSKVRRAYHRHFARAKRHGWTDESVRAFWRFWETLVARVIRLSTEGDLDQAEIKRMFGWSDAEG